MQVAIANKNEVCRSYTILEQGGDYHSFLDSIRCQDAVSDLPATNYKVIRSRKRLDYQATIRWTAKGADEYNQLSFRLESPSLGVKGFTEMTKEICEEHFPELLPYFHLNKMTAVGPTYMFTNAIFYALRGDVDTARRMTCLRAKPDSFFMGTEDELRVRFGEALGDLMLELENALYRLGFTY